MKPKDRANAMKQRRDEAVRRFGTRVKNKYPVGAVYGRLTVVGHDRLSTGCWAALCRCSCGKPKTVRYPNQMQRGLVNSCGCFNAEKASAHCRSMNPAKSRPPAQVAFDAVYRTYKQSAKLRNLAFEITTEAAKTLFNDVCYYCAEPPSAVQRAKQAGVRVSGYVYNGIDRINSAKGYTADNVVTCCKQCNRAKRDLSHNEFIRWARRVARCW